MIMVETILPILGQPPQIPKKAVSSGRLLIGVSLGRAVDLTSALVSQFLSEQFGIPFVKRRGELRSLAIEAFYDLLRHDFAGDAGFIAAIGTHPDATLAGAFDEFLVEMRLVSWKLHGLACIHQNHSAGPIIVSFDELPGVVEFIAQEDGSALVPPEVIAGQADESMLGHESYAVYAFGSSHASTGDIAEALTKFANDPVRFGITVWR
jgi:hypothetical protein